LYLLSSLLLLLLYARFFLKYNCLCQTSSLASSVASLSATSSFVGKAEQNVAPCSPCLSRGRFQASILNPSSCASNAQASIISPKFASAQRTSFFPALSLGLQPAVSAGLFDSATNQAHTLLRGATTSSTDLISRNSKELTSMSTTAPLSTNAANLPSTSILSGLRDNPYSARGKKKFQKKKRVSLIAIFK
jgi:hypothetical protein